MVFRMRIILGLFVFIGGNCFAQSDIFKCTDPSGNITYSNDSKSGTCEKTGLGIINKANTVNKLIGDVPQTNNYDKTMKDQKRKLILQGELNQEKQQLESISDMISRTNDNEQINRLSEMQNMHKRNISALQKELGNKTDVELLLPTNIGKAVPGRDVPISLPSKETNIDDNKGIITQVLEVFKSNGKKRQGISETTTPKRDAEEIPISITKPSEPMQQNVQSNNTTEPERVPLETNLITNKSIRTKQ